LVLELINIFLNKSNQDHDAARYMFSVFGNVVKRGLQCLIHHIRTHVELRHMNFWWYKTIQGSENSVIIAGTCNNRLSIAGYIREPFSWLMFLICISMLSKEYGKQFRIKPTKRSPHAHAGLYCNWYSKKVEFRKIFIIFTLEIEKLIRKANVGEKPKHGCTTDYFLNGNNSGQPFYLR